MKKVPGSSSKGGPYQPAHNATSQDEDAVHHEGVHAEDGLGWIDFSGAKVQQAAIYSEDGCGN